MHLADGIVSDPVVLGGAALAAGCSVAAALDRTSSDDVRAVAWAGTLGAFVLALQAVNVPLIPGASTHAVGAGLVTLAVGPARAIVTLTAVLIVQALLFADGGLLALGVNVTNLAVIPALAVGAARSLLRERVAAAAIVGTAAGSVLAGASLATVLVFGADSPSIATYAWLIGAQAVTGIAEGVLTALAADRLTRRAPALLSRATRRCPRPLDAVRTRPFALRDLRWVAVGAALAALAAPFASDAPDPLERLLDELPARR